MKHGISLVTSSSNCAFCRIRKGDLPAIKIFENHWTLGFMEPNPLSDGHTLNVSTAAP